MFSRLYLFLTASDEELSRMHTPWELPLVNIPDIPKCKPPKPESTDNGGTTSYYDLPKPSFKELVEVLSFEISDKTDAEYMAGLIFKMFPSTLNDLIEFKDMKPFQHEMFKATYALHERAEKGNASIERELNKIQYYLDRGKDLNFRKKL